MRWPWVSVLVWSMACRPLGPPTVVTLRAQLRGDACGYEFRAGACTVRARAVLDSLRNADAQCDVWAAQCLGEMKDPAAVDELIWALTNKADVQTCDGVLGVRSESVRALQKLNDRRALAPLKALAAASPRQVLSSTSSKVRFEASKRLREHA